MHRAPSRLAVHVTLSRLLTVQATRNGIRAGDLRDPDTFAAKLRVLALDGAKRFDGFEYDVEADIDTYKAIAERVLPMCADLFHAADLMQPR